MDRLFTAAILVVIFSGIIIYGYSILGEDEYVPPKTVEEPRPVEKPAGDETTDTTIQLEKILTTTIISQATTTSINESPEDDIEEGLAEIPEYVELTIDRVGGCMNTVRGKMNTLLVNATSNILTGDWGPDPEPRIYYTCDSGDLIEFDMAMFIGGKSIEAYSSLNNTYRLAAKCGRNQLVEDLADCKDLKILLDTSNVYVYTVNMEGVDDEQVVLQTTTTTLRRNTYLDRFRGRGYRKADYDIEWLCPTCVPAVNRIVIDEPGVVSRSIGYGQEINYAIYNPETVDLERITRLMNAGGDARLLNDTELL